MQRLTITAIFVAVLIPTVAAPTVANPADCRDMSTYESQDEYRSCLVEYTDKEDVLRFAEQDKSELTQKQIDAVHAVYPYHADEYGFTSGEERQITSWMAGVEMPSSSTDGGTATATPDSTQEQSDETSDRTVLHELGPEDDPKAYITNYEWDGRTVSVTIEAVEYTSLAVTDAGAFVGISEGSSSEVPYETYTIPSDTTRTIEFAVADGTGARAISVAAHGTMVGIVETGLGGPFSGDVGWAVVRAGVAAASLVVGGTALLTAILTWYAMRRDYRRVL